MQKLNTKIYTVLINPKTAFIIFTIFIITYLIILDEEGAFKKKFMNFGPSEDTTFLNMKLNTWSKVILVYLIGFFSSLLTTYYQTVSYDFIHSYIWNPAYTKKINISKKWTTAIVAIEPFLYMVLNTLNFFVNLTMELQYIIPKFIGNILVDIPYGLYKVNQKTYTS